MTDFEKKVIEVLSEKPFILTEYGEITTDKTYTIGKNPITEFVFSGKSDKLILATGDTKEELEEVYKEYREEINEYKESMKNGFLCGMQCTMCNSCQRVACYERSRENDKQ